VDSNYTLNSDIGSTTAQQEAEKITNDLNETLKPINKNLDTLKAMKDHLNTSQAQDTNLDTLKNELQALDPDLYNQLGLNFLNSPDELLHTLTTHENKLTTKKTELQAQADKAIERLIYNQKEKAKDKDAIKKEALNFIHGI
jgi:chaperonin cofactor prefoldin